MIRLFLRRGMLGTDVEIVHVEAGRGLTPAMLLAECRGKLAQSVPIKVAIDGELVTDDALLDQELRDGQQVVLLPATTYGVDIYAAVTQALISIAVSLAVSYVVYLLTPKPKPPGEPQDRGDDESSTYAWDGIKTNYGPGLPIPWLYGYHAVGGQGIWIDVSAGFNTTYSTIFDQLRLVLSLCEGPVYEVAGLQQNVNAVTVPVQLRVNDNFVGPPGGGAPRVWARMGTHDQPVIPAPFHGLSQVFTPNLTGQGQGTFVYTIPAQELPADQLRIVFVFPSGLWDPMPWGPNGIGWYVGIRWRRVGTSSSGTIIRSGQWLGTGLDDTFAPLGIFGSPGYTFQTYPFGYTITLNAGNEGFPLPADFVESDIELQFDFASSNFTPVVGRVDYVLLRDIEVHAAQQFRYPREALLGLELLAGERFSGQRPQIEVPVKGALVRVWDATHGWSGRCWQVPPAPHNFMVYPPGRNPAWCLLDFLLARWGLGKFLTEADLDLPAFRAWATFCDQDPNPGTPWGEAAFTVDIVGDVPRAAWDWVLAFCSAGRAAPVMRNGKISIVYQFRDAHSDQGASQYLTVPAKAPTQLLTSGNCESSQVTWLSRANRTTVFDFQFLNETKGWAQDVLPVEDEDGPINDPTDPLGDAFVRTPVQAYGVTRPGQLYREGRWQHRLSRMVRRQISGVVGPWALAAEVGDLIDFESELLRPFGTDVPKAMQVVTGGTATTTIVIDHALTGAGLQVVVRDADGKPQRRTISSYVNSGGQSTLTLASAVTCAAGATCAVGILDKVVETYELVSIRLTKELKREFVAVQWTPDAYTPVTKAEFEGASGTDDDPVLDDPDELNTPPAVLAVNVTATEERGTHRIAFARPGGWLTCSAKVYVRLKSTTLWQLVATTRDSAVLHRGMLVGQTYVVAVCLETRTGDILPPEAGTQVEFTPEEFAASLLPEPLSGVRADVVDDEVLLQWDDQEQGRLDVYEVRAGTQWVGAPVVARTRAPRVPVENPPGGVPLLVASRATCGLYGECSTIAAVDWTPPARAARLTENDLSPSPAGTHSGTQWNSTDQRIELVAGGLLGTYTSLEQDLGYQADFYWQVRFNALEWEDALVRDLTFKLNSGEARTRRVSGRPATTQAPGLDWRLKVSDLTMSVRDLPTNLLARGYRGVVGSHTQVLVESRFYTSGAWSAYRPHVDRIVTASKMQVRLTLGRRSQLYRPQVSHLTYVAFL